MNEWFDAEKHVERAHEHYEAGRWDEAEAELREAINLDPYQGEWHFNLGLTLEAAGRFDDAITAFDEASKLQPEDASSLLMIGVNLLRLDRPQDALAPLERAAAVDRQNMDIFVHRIEAHSRLAQHEQAELVFYLGQQVNPKHAELYAVMADSLMDRGLWDRAVWCLREAARLDAGLPGVQARLAEAYAATGRPERARQLYLLELRRNPGDIPTLLDLAGLLAGMNRTRESEEKLHRVLELEPDNADAHYSLGDLAERQGRIDVAQTHFEVVLRLNPQYQRVRGRLAGLMLGRRLPEAADAARKLLGDELAGLAQNVDGWSASELRNLGRTLLDARMTTDAVGVLRRLVERRPDDAESYHLHSVALLQDGDVPAGVAAAKSALKIDPRHVPALHNLALACMKLGQHKRARYWVRQALRHCPEDQTLKRLRFWLRAHVATETVSRGWVWCVHIAQRGAERLRGPARATAR